MALEPINYTTYSREIEQEYLKVVRGDDPDTTWLVISPNPKKEYAPEFVGTGFTEFLQTFDDAKVQYGMARVSPPGSDVEKLILIGWCPDSAPMKTRASFAANFGTVANQILKGYHIQVTARDEDDLDERELLQKISNAAGARYSIQTSTSKPLTGQPKKSAPIPAAASNPKQQTTVPTPNFSKDGKAGEKDAAADDWSEPEVEERDFDENPLKSNQSSYKPIGKIDLQKLIAEESAREDPRLVSSPVSSSKVAPEADIAHLKKESRLKRDTEINDFLGKRSPINSAISPRNDDLIIKGFKNEKSPAQLWAEKKAAESTPSTEFEKVPSVSKVRQQDEEEEHDVKDLKSKFEKLASSPDTSITTPMPTSKKILTTESEIPSRVKIDPKRFGNPLPGMHAGESNEEVEKAESDDDWDNDEPVAVPILPSREAVIKKEEKESYEVPASRNIAEQEDNDTFDDEREEASKPTPEIANETDDLDEEPAPSLPIRKSDATPSLPTRKEDAAPSLPSRRNVEPEKPAEPTLPSAVAEYDYEAAEDNELTFTENDKILNIDFVDDDWWLGELERTGEKGLFPSNYVSLQN